MRVIVRVELDIDTDAWIENYGVSKAEVRQDVKEHVQNGVYDQLGGLGLLVATEPTEAG